MEGQDGGAVEVARLARLETEQFRRGRVRVARGGRPGDREAAAVAVEEAQEPGAVGAVAAMTEMGIPVKAAIAAVASFKCGFGRMESFQLGKAGAKVMLVKNPAGCNQVLDFLQNVKEKFVLVVCLNDRGADGTDVSWIWDAEFEKLRTLSGRLERVIVSGDRAADMAVRVKYAGIDPRFVTLEHDYEKLVSSLENEERPVYMIPTYTAMLELRETLIRHCGGDEFWV